MKTLGPIVNMVSNMIKNTTVTPYQEDGFIYAGFTFGFDTVEEMKEAQKSPELHSFV